MIDYQNKTYHDGSIDILHSWQLATLKLVAFAGKRVVDIGCGSGSFLKAIQPTAQQVLGVDPNSQNVFILEANGIPVKQGYAEQYQRELAGQYDVATCFEVVEHLYDPWKLFEAAYRMLATGGLFVVSTPNAFHVLRGFDFLVLQRHRDILLDPTKSETPEHVRLWSASMLVRAFTRAGFNHVRIYGSLKLRGRVFVLRQSLLVRLFAQNLICVGVR